ncbi:MAG TPA: PipA/GogA/GtgA family type III secretion system effector [Herbaspirillum sp.]
MPRARRHAGAMPTPESASISARADAIFAQDYSLLFGETPQQSRAKLDKIDQELYESWRNLTDIDELRWTPAQDLPPTPLDLAYAQSEFAIHLLAHPTSDEAAARRLARYHMFYRPVTVIEPPSLDALYQSVLQRGLHWINLDAVRARRMSPARILQAVCRYRGQSVAADSSLTRRLRNYRDVIADEAALIYFHAQSDCRAQPDCEIVARNTPIHAIRAHFATALIDEWQDAGIGSALLPSTPIAPRHAKFWYDGFSLQNADGLRLQEIVNAIFTGAPYVKEAPIVQRFIDRASRTDHLPGYPGRDVIDATRRDTFIQSMHGDIFAIFRYEKRPATAYLGGVYLTLGETLVIVAKRMRALMLGRHYPRCSVLDAVETTMLRLGPLHGIGLEAMHDPARLVKAYNKLGNVWNTAPRFAIAPSPYAGQYLTRCRNVLYLTENAKLTRDQQIVVQVATLFLPALVIALRSASKERQMAEVEYWGRVIWYFMGRRSGLEHLLEQHASPERQGLHQGVKTAISVRKDATETIRYGNRTDLHRQLHHYMEEEMLTISPLPEYDEEFQVNRILRRTMNMSDHDLQTLRSVKFISASAMGTGLKLPDAYMTPPEEFKMRAKHMSEPMRFGSHAIDAAQALRHARQVAAELLTEDRVVRAKSKEMMRRHGIPQDAQNAQRIRRSLASGLVGIAAPTLLDNFLAGLDALFGSPTLKSALDAILSGEPKRILSLLPFIVPAYDIARGALERDLKLLESGILHFGEDLVMTALGLGVEKILAAQLARDADAVLALRRRMASEPSAGMFQELAELPASVARIEAEPSIAETSFIEGIGGGNQAAQTLPKAVADTPAMPDQRTQLTLYLIDEKRWVPVKPRGSAFVETDLRGNVLADAQIIFGDLPSRRGYRLARRRRTLSATGAVDLPEVMGSATVTDIQAYWQHISRLPNIRARRADPRKIIKALFALADDAPSETLRQALRRIYTRYRTFTRFEEFWLQAYQLSNTAAEILNAAYDKLSFTGNAEVSFHADRAHVIGSDIHLPDADALANLHYVSLDGVTPFERERMLVHEVLHALAKTADTDVLGERGGTVYLTGRILFELGSAKSAPTRLAYKMPPVFNPNEAAHQLWAEHLLDIHDVTIAQDLVLDRMLTAGRTVSSSAMVLGEKIGERATVRQGSALAEYMRAIPKFGNGDIMRLSQFAAATFDSSAYSYFPSMLRTMMFGSKTARELTYAWLQRPMYGRTKVLSLDFHMMDGWVDAPVNAHIISGKRLWINTEPLYYYSERGLIAMTPKRRYVGCIVDFLLGEIMPSLPSMRMAGRFRNRGLAVLLENEILEQIGERSPPRICAELSLDPTSYHHHLTTVRRAADTENDFLHKMVREFLEARGISPGDDLLAITEARPPSS